MGQSDTGWNKRKGEQNRQNPERIRQNRAIKGRAEDRKLTKVTDDNIYEERTRREQRRK